MPRSLALAALLCALLATPAFAGDDDATLTIGDPAPSIDIAHWVKGVEMDRRGRFTPLTDFEKGKITVLEFWATWCGPCRAGMPHLSEIQETFADKGVTVISISDESLPKVYEFLWTKDRDGKIQNDRTRYILTTDPDRSVHDSYMKAAGQGGIPTAFVIGKDGLVEWIGHPSQLDDVLEAVVSDTWDREAFKVEFEKAQRIEKIMRAARRDLQAAAQAGDWETVIGIFDKILEVDPTNAGVRMQKLNLLLTRIDDEERTYLLAKEIAKDAWEDDANTLNMMAWTIVDNPAVKHRNLGFAEAAALRASELTKNEDASILDTVGRIFFEEGKLAEAVTWQRKAVANAPEGQLREGLQKALAKYEAAAGDAPEKEATKEAASFDLVVDKPWALVSILGHEATGEKLPALQFLKEGKVAAFGGVNRMIGPWTVDADGKLEIGPLAGTRMSGTPEMMRQEEAVSKALDLIDGWRLAADGNLELLTGEKVVLVFKSGA